MPKLNYLCLIYFIINPPFNKYNISHNKQALNILVVCFNDTTEFKTI